MVQAERSPVCSHPTTDAMEVREEPYHGNKNFETWSVSWWLTNDQVMCRRCRALAIEASHAVLDSSLVFDGIWTTAEAIRNLLADALRELVGELNPVADQTSLFTDLMDTALGEVDWHEIADEFLKEGSAALPPSNVL